MNAKRNAQNQNFNSGYTSGYEGRYFGSDFEREVYENSVVLIDVVNPQPKSSRAFYAKIKATQVKADLNRRHSGRVNRHITTKRSK